MINFIKVTELSGINISFTQSEWRNMRVLLKYGFLNKEELHSHDSNFDIRVMESIYNELAELSRVIHSSEW